MLYVYLGSIIIFWIIAICVEHDLKKEIKRRKIKFIKTDKLTNWIKIIIISLTPIFNLIIILEILFSDRIKEEVIVNLQNKYGSIE